MKKILAILACGAFLTPALQAESYTGTVNLKGETLKEGSFMGPTTLTNVKAESLDVLGSLEFHNLEVKNKTSILGAVSKSTKGKLNSLDITGTFDATDVTCTELNALGSVTVTNLEVENGTEIVGPLHATNSHLHNLTITSDEILLKDTEVDGNITIQENKSLLGLLSGVKKQVLRLEGKTNVKGTITFKSGTGTVEQGPDTKVEGKITGATVEKK